MAEKEGLSIEEEQLIHDARIYAMRHGKMSGRVANQFIKQVKLDAQTT
jgi:predicted AAA+ superfamily ATPase